MKYISIAINIIYFVIAAGGNVLSNGTLLSSTANMTPLQVPSAIPQSNLTNGAIVTDMLSSTLSSDSLTYSAGQLSQIPSLSHLGNTYNFLYINL